MAQTKRKRQTKHRGNAAGMIEARGRTGRAPTSAEKGGKGKDGEKVPRQDRPPSWSSAFMRAAVATIALVLIGVLFIKNGAKVLLPFFPVILGVYTVIGYQTDKVLYNRRMRRKAEGKIA
jgi:hypothetical protein